MSINWDTPFRLPRSEISNRLRRVAAFKHHSDLRAKLIRALLEHADNNVYITVGGLVMIVNVTIGQHRTTLSSADLRTLNMMLTVLFQQLTTALLDDLEIRQVVLQSLYDTNSITDPDQ